jgi:ATP-dependent exoDNAse (exonuclease V) beta subunit
VVDCLVYQEASVTILEFKTGRPRPEHQVQVEIYRRAIEALVPDRQVDVVMVYAQNDGGPQGASA